MSLPVTEPVGTPVRIWSAPRREPPFDDELSTSPCQLVGPLDQPLPFGAYDEPVRPWSRRLVQVRDPFAAAPTARCDLPDPCWWTRRLLIAIFETVAGRRSARQLTPLLSAPIAAAFSGPAVHTGRLSQMVRSAHPPVVRTVRVGEPADGVAEVAATVSCGPRVHAIALRLEGLDGRWRCVRLQVA